MGAEFVMLKSRTGYLPGATNIGLFLHDVGKAVVIDSGNDKEAGRKVLSALKTASLELSFIVNTHSNADHIGGNRFLQDRTGCHIIAPGIESAGIEHPVLEPSMLYGGYPPDDLRGKFFMAQSSAACADGFSVLPSGVKPIDLPGHYLGMCGYLTEDGVFFAADSVFSKEILDKYHIVFIYDVEAFLSTLDMLPGIACDLFVPSHAEPTEDISALVEANRKKVLEIAHYINCACLKPASPDEIIKRVFDGYRLSMDMSQYALGGSTIRSYLTYLCRKGSLSRRFEDNRLLFEAVE